MKPTDSALRLLVKSYTSGLIDREQYLEVRQQLLKKLSSQGSVTEEDLKNFYDLYQNTETQLGRSEKQYSFSEWIIIILGLLAAAALGFILYS